MIRTPHSQRAMTRFFWGISRRFLLPFVGLMMFQVATSLQAAEPAPDAQIFTTQNLWYRHQGGNNMGLNCINSHLGEILPAGTEVEGLRIDRRIIWFETAAEGHQFYIQFKRRHHPGFDVGDYVSFLFSKQTFSELTAEMTDCEILAIRKAIVVPGMSRKAVLVSFGRPSERTTASLDLSEWTFFSSRPDVVVFEGDQVIEFRPHQTLAVNGLEDVTCSNIEAFPTLCIHFNTSLGGLADSITKSTVQARDQVMRYMEPRFINIINRDLPGLRLMGSIGHAGNNKSCYQLTFSLTDYGRRDAYVLSVNITLSDPLGRVISEKDYQSRSRRGWDNCCLEIIQLVWADVMVDLIRAFSSPVQMHDGMNSRLLLLDSIKERLAILKALLVEDVITQEEHDTRREEILQGL